MSDEEGVVVVVEDEPGLAALYEEWLGGRFAVRVADDAASGLEAIDDEVDVVLLDRRLPDRPGGDVLDAIRHQGYDARVVMVTAVDPDFDVVEMGFDTYLTKPVDADDLTGAVEAMLGRRAYDDRLKEYLSLVSKRAALERDKPTSELERSDAFADLSRQIETLESELDDLLAGFDDDDFRAAFLTVDADAVGVGDGGAVR
jgi:DNA-binding response OmpR family regulator